MRHGGPLSSIAEYWEADGSRQERYYRPLNEATLLYSPVEGVIEVFSPSPAVRQQVAASFAEAGLKLDLSGKPLTLKQYHLGRFLDSLLCWRKNPIRHFLHLLVLGTRRAKGVFFG